MQIQKEQLQDDGVSFPLAASVPFSDAAAETTPTSRRRVVAVVTPLIALQLALWLGLFVVAGLFRDGPNGKSMGTDFAVFTAAAQVLRDGGNPYDYHVLYRTERALLKRQHLPVTKMEYNVRAGNPPIFYWTLEPLTGLPFQPIAMVWILSMYAVSAIGLLACLRYLNWSHWRAPIVIFLLMPQVILGACYGNIHGLLLCAVGCSLLLSRRHPFAGGALMSLAWLKPQLVLPVVLLLALFHVQARGRFVTGFVVSTLGLTAVSGVAAGWHSYDLWLGGLVSWSHGAAAEPNLSSLVGLYIQWAPVSLKLGLEAVGLGVAFGTTIICRWRLRNHREVPFHTVAWLWFVWFLVTPFAHYPDEILLAPAVLALLGRDGRRFCDLLPVVAVYLTFLAIALFPSYGLPANLLSLSILVVGILLVVAARSPGNDEGESSLKPAWSLLP